jgi:hypothetical protein
MHTEVPHLNISSVIAFIAMGSKSSSSTLSFLKKNDPSYSHLDWNNAENWKIILEDELAFDDFPLVCRAFCFRFVMADDLMLLLAGNGREAVISNLNSDELQVFRNARLLEKLPPQEVVEWWDYLKIFSKKNLNEILLKQGRLAEYWTIAEERKKIAAFTDLLPEMISLDGDRYGYDILSYRLNNLGSVIPVQIEVKSYADKSYPHIYLTKNEWDKGVKAKASYFYYVWCIETEKYVIVTIEDLIPHVPENRGLGKWQTVLLEIELHIEHFSKL